MGGVSLNSTNALQSIGEVGEVHGLTADAATADELRTELTNAGAVVVGPVGSLAEALELVGSQGHLDGAVVDVNLGGEMAFPAADALIERSVPLVFTTGYDEDAIPEQYRRHLRCEKPVNILRMTSALGKGVGAAR